MSGTLDRFTLDKITLDLFPLTHFSTGHISTLTFFHETKLHWTNVHADKFTRDKFTRGHFYTRHIYTQTFLYLTDHMSSCEYIYSSVWFIDNSWLVLARYYYESFIITKIFGSIQIVHFFLTPSDPTQRVHENGCPKFSLIFYMYYTVMNSFS